MISEISQPVVGTRPMQLKGGSDSSSRLQEPSVVGASNHISPVKPGREESISLIQAAVGKEEIGQVVDNLNNYAQSVQRQLEFSVDEESGKTIVRVIDAKTGETIRDIPPEEVLNMQKQLKETSEQIFRRGEAGVSLLFQGKA